MGLPVPLQPAQQFGYRIDLPTGESYQVSADHELSADELRMAAAKLGASSTSSPSSAPKKPAALPQGPTKEQLDSQARGEWQPPSAAPKKAAPAPRPNIFDPTTSSTMPPPLPRLTKDQAASQARGEYQPPPSPYAPLPARTQHILETQRMARIAGIPWAEPNPRGGDNWDTYDRFVRNVAAGRAAPSQMETWNQQQGTGYEHIQKAASALGSQTADVVANGLSAIGLDSIAQSLHWSHPAGTSPLEKSLALANPLQYAATGVGVITRPRQALQSVGDAAQNIATGKGSPDDFLAVAAVVLPALKVAAPNLVPGVAAHIESMLPPGKTNPAMVEFLAKGGSLADVEAAVRSGEAGPKNSTIGALPQPAGAPPPIGARTELSPDLLARRGIAEPVATPSVAVDQPPALPVERNLSQAAPTPALFQAGRVPNPRGRFFALADELGLPSHIGENKQIYYDFAQNVLGRPVKSLSEISHPEWTLLANAMQEIRGHAGVGAFAESPMPAADTVSGLQGMAAGKSAAPATVDMAAVREKALADLGPNPTPEQLATAVGQVREGAAPQGPAAETPKPLPDENDPFAAFAEPKTEPGTSVRTSKRAGSTTLLGPRPTSADVGKIWEAFDGITRNSKLLGHLSAPFMQGRDLLFVDPKAWLSGWKPMFEGLAQGDAGAAALRSRMEVHPLWDEFSKSGGEQILSKQHGAKSDMEETFAGDWGSNIPGFGKAVEHSSATFNGFLNAARFRAWTDAMEFAPSRRDPVARRMYANEMVNTVGTMTGRSTSALATKARGLSSVAFSPGYKVSTVENNLAMPAFKANTAAGRSQAFKMYGRRAAGYATLIVAAKAMGMKVHIDPRDSEFGLVDVGKNHIDLFGRAGDTLKYLTRAFVGRVTQGGKVEGPSLKDTAWNYAQNEATPMVRAGINLTQGERGWDGKQTRNVFGQASGEIPVYEKNPPKFSWSKFLSDLVGPISEESSRVEYSHGANLAPWLNPLGIMDRAPSASSGGGPAAPASLPGMPRAPQPPSTRVKLPGLPAYR